MRDELRRTIRHHLASGSDVELELLDGSNVDGTVAWVDDDGIHLYGRDAPVPLDQLVDLVLDISTEGPE